MKTILIFLGGLVLGLLIYFGYSYITKPVITTELETNVPVNQEQNNTVPLNEESNSVDSPTAGETSLNVAPPLNEERVYKITFNTNAQIVRDIRFNDFGGVVEFFIIKLFDIKDLEKLTESNFKAIGKLFNVKAVYSGEKKSIVTYYMWLDKSVPKIDTTKTYVYKNITAVIEPASLDLKPYLFSNTYCQKSTDCTGDGSACSVYATNSFESIYGVMGCVVANYPAEDPNFVAQEDAKCREKSVHKDWASWVDISYSSALCVQNKCVPEGRKVSCK